MAEAIVSIVMGRITDLLIEDAQLLQGVKDEIQQVVTELKRMKTFLRHADSRKSEKDVRILLTEIRDLAYDAEHVVESFLVKASSSPGKIMQWMNKRTFLSKIKDIQRKKSLLFNRFRDYNIKSTLESPESSNSSEGPPGMLKRFHTFTTVEPEIFVGFQADVDRLVGYLVDERDDSYPLISICGMGGLGKTTLAQKIYNHAAIKKYFAGLAWVSISQKWQTKQVLQRILICLVHEKKEEIITWDDDKLVNNLLQIQQKKKCLIVLDDIWSNDAWDSIKAAFTTEKSLSKLLLTSRNVNVAEYINPKGLIHLPGYLSEDQSWELLQLKALPTRGDYLDIARDFKRMENLGREMVRYCAGLPLAIVILGGILVTKPSLIEWEKVYNDSLSSLKKREGLGEKQQEQLFDILVRSYNVLPPQLKPCFIYLSKFMEDEWIDAETLYQLWIAEGIVLSSDKREGETMMQVAESYMRELVHRSMVQVRFNDLKSSVTKFESYSLHDLMRDLSLSKAKEEDFFEAIDLREGNDFHLSKFAYTRQLVVHCHGEYSREKARSLNFKKPNHQKYRSMLLMNDAYKCGSLKPVLGSHLANFKLLRVLALENVYLDCQTVSGNRFGTSIGRVIGSLIYLRYLSARESNLIIIPWIQKLVLLQTLKLDRENFYNFFNMSPGSSTVLGKLAHLHHLYLPLDEYDASSRKNFKLRFNGLSKLETLENFDTRGCEVKDLPKLSSLRRLKLKAVGNYDEVKEMFMYLHKLVSSNSCLQYLALVISISDRGLVDNPDMIKELLWNHKFNLHEMELTITGRLPELCELFEQQQQLNHTHFDVSFIRITKLELKWSCLKEDPMAVLEKIPTLRDLSMIGSYMGKEMVCSAMGFPTLTRLRMWNLPNLEKWRVEEGSMPILQHLEIRSCRKLEELPEGLNSLRKLILDFMPSEFCDRLRSKNGEQGPDFYKVAHIPHLDISHIRGGN